MRKKLNVFYLLPCIAVVFIFLFVYTALSKLLELHTFLLVLGASPLLGSQAVWLAWALPLSELIVALLLLFPRTQVAGIRASFLMMLVFTGYIGYMLLLSPHLPCSCGGVIRQLTWEQHLVFNVLLTLLAGWGCLLARQRRRVAQGTLYDH